MTQVSRLPLRRKVEQRVYELLLESIAAADSAPKVERFLSDLLSPTERLMIAKRISIALLLIKNYDQRTIAKWLKVSLTTVSKISTVLQRKSDGYKTIVSAILKKERFKSLLRNIDDAIGRIMPPLGRNWGHWKREQWKQKMEDHKPF
ncbi:hypothetical protein HY947_01570 [Candidatus Gottesmanbacteria bacterium]|nr:hypothetical protein [Candidatus Gottesmanbacteria bacterium]